MSDKQTPVKAKAIVSLTVEIELHDRWGGSCGIDQIRKQAAESAIDTLGRALTPPHLSGDPPDEHKEHMGRLARAALRGHCRIVGLPRVTAVLAEEDR